jgi:hypothetical protein
MLLGLGALMMGFFGMGVWGMAPAYSNESFPTEVRGVGPGFCYHAAAAIGATMPTVLGFLKDQGFVMVNAMSLAMILSGLPRWSSGSARDPRPGLQMMQDVHEIYAVRYAHHDRKAHEKLHPRRSARQQRAARLLRVGDQGRRHDVRARHRLRPGDGREARAPHRAAGGRRAARDRGQPRTR